MRLVWGTISAVRYADDGVQYLDVAVDAEGVESAASYPRLAGECAQGDRVLLNTTAEDLSLGTGGMHFVVARLGTGTGVVHDRPSGGHVMKMRYTPLQTDVLAIESQESPYHDVMRGADDLGGMPVVCCGLHSQVPLVAAAIKQANPLLKVAYCMDDSAGMAMPLSEIVREGVAAGLFDATFSCGQAFGGQHEAVNLHSGLLAARHIAGADVAISGIGPGVVGTSTAFGHGGVAQGEAINAAGALGGRPVAVLRLSFADTRSRHRVVSHHTLVALSRIALAPARVAMPRLPNELAGQVDRMLDDAGVWERHERVDPPSVSSPDPDLCGLTVTTMGRGLADDPAFFHAAFAAGALAGRMVADERA